MYKLCINEDRTLGWLYLSGTPIAQFEGCDELAEILSDLLNMNKDFILDDASAVAIVRGYEDDRCSLRRLNLN